MRTGKWLALSKNKLKGSKNNYLEACNYSTVTDTFSFAGSTIDGRNGTVTEGKFSAKVITQ